MSTREESAIISVYNYQPSHLIFMKRKTRF